jgi:HEAT repeat protein/cyclophilin family peptidyl-prolyl cis-trans isomerase
MLRDDGGTPTASLADLIQDPDAGIRRRAALAIGRVKDAAGVPWLVTALSDPIVDVRATAAFGLGLLGDRSAVAPLVSALTDMSSVVRGRAIEALGLIGDTSAVAAVYQAASGCKAHLARAGADEAELDVCRLALYALVRLQSYDAIAGIALGPDGEPVSRWWPVAYALQRINDRRAVPALRTLAAGQDPDTTGFALRGLAMHKDAASLAIARRFASDGAADVKVRIAAVRLLAQVGDESDVRLLASLFGTGPTNAPLALEAIAALGTLARPSAFDALVDLFGDSDGAVRAAALAAAARSDPERFFIVLSGLARDRDWSVRSALATVLATLPADRVKPALLDLAEDPDARVIGAALQGLATIKASELSERLFAALAADDFVVRGAAARLLGETKPAGGLPRLVAAYTRGQSDAAYGARASALEALAAYGGDEAIKVLESALADREWPVRTRAAQLLAGLGRTASPLRPAPLRQTAAFFESTAFLQPPYSPHAFIDTRHGVVEIQLDVVDAPVTSVTFMELARSGFFAGIKVHRLVPTFVIQAGDPRGDGEGGPGFTIRDELSPTPYLRGTVGMALDWADTAGSQWFITLSPQPHLDARYTVFGRVVSGWDVLDRVSPWDVIERIRIWDGIELR